MYTPAAFQLDEPAALALIDAHPLATLVCSDAEGSEVNLLPLLRVGGSALIGHIARANPLWQRFAEGARALAVFHGAQGYVHPGWYPAKREHGKVVPTWNYEAVVVHGRIRWQHDAATLLSRVEALTRHMEAPRTEPWQVSDAPPAYTEALLRAIVGLHIDIERIEAKAKLSQNHPAANREGVIQGLVDPDDPRADPALAAAMSARALDR
ncbi:FMN-binding negative transcriptional regulator [Aquimonas voraii]|uniref:Negative transcriptional regulator, PaiB family n=1 Tax=Aquimonas voraii TaxID=265719 RepID=A0A1G6VIF8_9GAMM|nr:FMN-binding negative transcriptional regulator [Aquimonas voraii]SDD53402.1 negative transcriptional regulator, PaiB family [Aquimonas voraii]